MSWLLLAIFVEVSVLVASSVEEFIHRGRGLVTAFTPLCFRHVVMVGTSIATPIVCVALTRAIVVVLVLVVSVACCYHVDWVSVSIAVSLASLTDSVCS
jgi:hypothetical protein